MPGHHTPPKTLRGWRLKRRALLEHMKTTRTGFHKQVQALNRVNVKIEELARGKQMADPLYWKRLQEEAKKIGWRGEYAVVSWLKKRGWFAKRSYGSWGVDAYASKGFQSHGEVSFSTPNARSILIDVKSSDSWSPGALLAKSVDEAVLKEAERTRLPIVRACCVKGSKPVFYWWATGEQIEEAWFD